MSVAVAPAISPQEQQWLLAVARTACERAARGEAPTSVRGNQPSHVAVDEAMWTGAFVSLHEKDGGLRGCVGYISSPWGIVESVARAAEGATIGDPRFEPVRSDELAELVIEVSLLGTPFPIAPEDVIVGRHGLILEIGRAHGLLLPQVPVTWGWDRAEFLEQTARKAGLPPGAWKHAGAKLLGFEAAHFSRPFS